MIPAQGVEAARDAMKLFELRVDPDGTMAWEAYAKVALEAAAPYMLVHVHHHDIEAHARSFNEGYEAAVTQGLADDPSLADDWLQAKLREARAQALEDAARAIEIDNRNSRAKMARHFRNAHAAKLREMAASERGEE